MQSGAYRRADSGAGYRDSGGTQPHSRMDNSHRKGVEKAKAGKAGGWGLVSYEPSIVSFFFFSFTIRNYFFIHYILIFGALFNISSTGFII